MATDNFSVDANPLGSPWASCGSFSQLQASGGGCLGLTADDTNVMRYSTSSTQSSQVRVTTLGGRDGGPALFDASMNGYIVSNYDSTDLHVTRCDAGTFTGGPIASATGAYATNALVRMYRDGNDIVCSINGAETLRVTDATYMSLNPAIFMYDATLRLDEWTDGAAEVGLDQVTACFPV